MSLSLTEATTLIIAVAGLALGLRGEWRAHRHDQVRIRIRPKVAYPIGPHESYEPRWAFELINEGTFPVTIDEIGFLKIGTRSRFAINDPLRNHDVSWPARLEPHASVTVYALIEGRTINSLDTIRCAYAETATGRVIRGTSAALKEISTRGEIPALRRTLSRKGTAGFICVSDYASQDS